MNWTREDFYGDWQRHRRELDGWLAQGLTDEHPLVRLARRRMETIARTLTDPRFGMTAVPVPHPTCIDVTASDQTPRSEWACGPQCPEEA